MQRGEHRRCPITVMAFELDLHLDRLLILKLFTLQVQGVKSKYMAQAYLNYHLVGCRNGVLHNMVGQKRQPIFQNCRDNPLTLFFHNSVRQTNIMRSSPGRNYFKVKRKKK